jgi:hypothetical protein
LGVSAENCFAAICWSRVSFPFYERLKREAMNRQVTLPEGEIEDFEALLGAVDRRTQEELQ